MAGTDRLLPLEELVRRLGELEGGAAISEGVRAMANKAPLSVKQVEGYQKILEELSKKNLVKSSETRVPDGIAPPGLACTLTDVKVNSRGGPDDKVYRNNEDLRKMLPRGCTILQTSGASNEQDFVIFANKKFIGGVGDEDEEQPENDEEWKKYLLAPMDTVSKVVCTTKLNGEAAHFSVRYIQGQFYIFAGSKNVHMMLRDRTDIDKYTEQRFDVARVVAHSVFDAFEDLSQDKRLIVYSLLHHTKLTALGELLQPGYQHIVNLEHLDKPQLNIITLTATYSLEKDSLTAFPPHHIIDLMKSLGYSTTDYDIIDYNDSEVKDRMLQVRNGQDTEGEVWYFLTDEGNTVGLNKVKCVWYIMLRAMREKCTYHYTTKRVGHDRSLPTLKNKTSKRFHEIQKWLQFNNEELSKWEAQMNRFLDWVHRELSENNIESTDFRPRFPILWKRFLQQIR